MADQRQGGISWTNETWNPIRGCSKVSEGCRNCYAMNVAARFSGPGQPYEGLALQAPARWTGQVKLVGDKLADPLRWKRPRLIFVNSMSDLFHESLAFEQIDQIVAVMALARQHTFQVLTKRPERMAAYLASRAKSMAWPLANVWWGTSVEDQAALETRMPSLLACRNFAAVLWLSMEPLLGPVSLADYLPVPTIGGVELEAWPDWVVVGGESGTNARPMWAGWARAIRDECRAAGVPFHFKQHGEFLDAGQILESAGRPVPVMTRVGKKAAGRLLDGVVHDAMPVVGQA